MVKPKVIIITSESCGHCRTMRRTGDITEFEDDRPPSIPGGYKWDQSFFTKLLFGVKDVNEKGSEPLVDVIEIYCKVLRFSTFNDVKELNTITWNGNKVERVSRQSGNIDGKMTVTVDNVTKDTDEIFEDYLKKNISPQLFRFVGFFPQWMYIDGQNWADSFAMNGDNKFVTSLHPNIPGLNIVPKEVDGSTIYVSDGPLPSKVTSPIVNVISLIAGSENA